MLILNVNVGEGVQIGNEPDQGAGIRILARSGQSTRLSVATQLPVTIMRDGQMPVQFTRGITGMPRRILEDLTPLRAVG